MLQRFFSYLLKNQIILALFIIGFGWFIIQIRDILVSVFLSYIIMAAILPFVEYLRRKKFPKILAVLIPYVGMLVAIFLLILPLIPFVIAQIQSFAKGFPLYLRSFATVFGYQLDPRKLELYLNSQGDALSRNALDFTTKVFGGIFSVITIFIVSFYLLLYHDSFKKFVADLFQPHRHAYVLRTVDQINEKLGAWFRGQIILSLFIGLLSWIALSILGLPYALPLALLAGILEVVPTLGPILSAIPSVIVALTVSPTLALSVVIIYVLIQSIEGNFLVPQVMRRAVGLNPVVVILGIMIGANLMGIAGALLAIPFISFITVIIQSLTVNRS